MLQSIFFIKSVHTAVFVFLNGVLALLLYETIADRVTILSGIAVALFLLEGIILLVNGGRCPLAIYVENLSSTPGKVSDIFLPLWFAERICPLYTTVFAVALILLVI